MPVLLLDAKRLSEVKRKQFPRAQREGYGALRERAAGYSNPEHPAYLGEAFWSGEPLGLLDGPPEVVRYVAQAIVEGSFQALLTADDALHRLWVERLRQMLEVELTAPARKRSGSPSKEMRLLSEARLFLACTIGFDHLYRGLETKQRTPFTAAFKRVRAARNTSSLMGSTPPGSARILACAGDVLSTFPLSLAERMSDRKAFQSGGDSRWLSELHKALLNLENELAAAAGPQRLFANGLDAASEALWALDVIRALLLRAGVREGPTYNTDPVLAAVALAWVPESGACVNPFNVAFAEDPFLGWPPRLGDLLKAGIPERRQIALTETKDLYTAGSQLGGDSASALDLLGQEMPESEQSRSRRILADRMRNVFARRGRETLPTPLPVETVEVSGWRPPRTVEQPTPWAAWLRLRVAASPNGVAAQLWTSLDGAKDSHVGSIVLPWPPSRKKMSARERVGGLMPKIGLGTSLLKVTGGTESVLWAVQQDVRNVTEAESICGHLVVDQGTPWRWVERWPSDLIPPATGAPKEKGLTSKTIHVWRSPGRTDRWHILRERLPYAQRLAWVIVASRGVDALPEYYVDLQLGNDEEHELPGDYTEHLMVRPERKMGQIKAQTMEDKLRQRQETRERQKELGGQKPTFQDDLTGRNKRIDFITSSRGLRRVIPMNSDWGNRLRLQMSPHGAYTSYLLTLADRVAVPLEVKKLNLTEGVGWRLNWMQRALPSPDSGARRRSGGRKDYDLMALSHGEGIEGNWINSDALAVLLTRMSRGKSGGLWTFAAIETTTLRARISSTKPKGTLLVESPEPVTVVLDGRSLIFMDHAPDGATIYAPRATSVRDRDGAVPYRVKYNHVIVDRNRKNPWERSSNSGRNGKPIAIPLEQPPDKPGEPR